MPTNLIQLVLTCGSWQEAQRIVDHLLGQQLITKAEFIPVKAPSGNTGSRDENDEIKLIMESAAHLFDAIDREVATLHSFGITRVQHAGA